MMFVIGGIPRSYFDELQKRFSRALVRQRSEVITAPLRGSIADADHADALLAILQRKLQSDRRCLSDGICVLGFGRAQEIQFAPFFKRFYPFAISCRVQVDLDPGLSEFFKKQRVREAETLLASAAVGAARAVDAMKVELMNRLKRSPLLLPVCNFGAGELTDSLWRVFAEASTQANPAEFVHDMCNVFESSYPYQKHQWRGFLNHRGIQFRSPGRDLHGVVWQVGSGEHNAACSFNGFVRLGAPIHEGFHFDCLKGGAALVGNFQDCHGVVGRYAGDPHLNIYPNDFVRA